MKNTTKRILLVSTFMLTASHAANPVDSTNTPSTTAATVATAAEPSRLNTYPQLGFETPFPHFYKRITDCLTEHRYVRWLESDEKNIIPDLDVQAEIIEDQVSRLEGNVKGLEAELPKITEQDKKLDALIASATAKLDAGRKTRYTKEEEDARWAEQKNIKAMQEEKAKLQESRSQRLDELHKTKRNLAIALRSVPSKLVQRYRLLMKAATTNSPEGWRALIKEIETHNERRSKEIAALDVLIVKASTTLAETQATLASSDATKDAKDQATRKLEGEEKHVKRLRTERDAKMALIVETTPDILTYLIQFSQVMKQRILLPEQEPQTLRSALGVWGRFDPEDSLMFGVTSVDAGSIMAKEAFEKAPFFGNNSAEFLGETGLEVPLAPTFEQVLAAMREFVRNPFGKKKEQTTSGSESGPAAAVE